MIPSAKCRTRSLEPTPRPSHEVEWMASHNDKVSVWCYASGTHQNPWVLAASMGNFAGRTLEPPGRTWRMAASATYQVADDRIADVWALWDWLGLLSQLKLWNSERGRCSRTQGAALRYL